MVIKIIIIMKKKRNTTQMKEQTRNTEVQINEEPTGKLPENEFIAKGNAVILILSKLSDKFFEAKYSLII